MNNLFGFGHYTFSGKFRNIWQQIASPHIVFIKNLTSVIFRQYSINIEHQTWQYLLKMLSCLETSFSEEQTSWKKLRS